MHRTAIPLVFLLSVIFMPIAIAQDEPTEEVEFPCTLKPGDSYRLEITRSRLQSGPDVRAIDQRNTQTTTFEVSEQNEQGFVLSWKSDWEDISASLRKLGQTDADWVEDIIQEAKDHVLLIQTDELATPIGLLNSDETMAMMERVMNKMLAGLDLDDEKRQIMERALQTMMSPQFILNSTLETANLYFVFTGGSYEVGAAYAVEDQLASPYGGDPIPAEIEFGVTEVDRSMNVAQAVYLQETDSEAAKARLMDFMKRAAGDAAMVEELEEWESSVEMGIFSRADYVMDLTTGLPHRVDYERTINMGYGERIDGISIVRVPSRSEPAREDR